MRTQKLFRTLLSFVLGALVLGGVANATIIYVDDDGGGDYLTISEAVANAVDGDVIIVAPGTYVEEVIVDVSVTIAGSGVDQTFVMPATSNPGTGIDSQVTTTTWLFRIQDDDVTITGLTVDGNNPALSGGIDARGGIITDYSTGTYYDLEVLNCRVQNLAYRGIYAAAGGKGHSFLQNTVSNVNDVYLESAGIFFYDAQGEARLNVVDNCSIGLGFHEGGGGTLDDNDVSLCDLGILVNGSTAATTVVDNVIDDCGQGMQTTALDGTVDVLTNTTNGCGTGLACFGLGTGSTTADGNTLDGQGNASSNGVFVSTDVHPWGYAAVTVLLQNNLLTGNDYAVVGMEDPALNTPVLSCTLSSDANEYNTFYGSGSFNVFLQDCNDNVDATHNFWGAVNSALIEATLWHQVDDPLLGLVDYSDTVDLYITVDDDGTADYTTINPAVQDLLPGGTIFVMPGLYVEDVLVDRSCVIQGSGTSANPTTGTILQGATIALDMVVVTVTASDVFLENMRIDGQQLVYDQAGMLIYGANISGLTVTDCVLHTAISALVYDEATQGSFLRNEVFDFGINPSWGGGIYLIDSGADVGIAGNGNYVHDGLSPGILFTAASDGLADSNTVDTTPLGLLANASGARTVFQRNEVRDCDQGFQSVGCQDVVDFYENSVFDCTTGFMQFGYGGQLHTYVNNYVHHRLSTPGSSGFFFTTEYAFGDDDVNVVGRGNVISGADYGIIFDESVSSQGFVVTADLDGSTNPNWITGAGVQDVLLQLCDDDIDAGYNYFGSTDVATVEDKITHKLDDSSLGLVDFSGLQAPAPNIRRRGELSQGKEIALVVAGDIGRISLPVYGSAPAYIPTPWGILLIDPTTVFTLNAGVVGPSGLQFTEVIIVPDFDPGLTFYFQALVGLPGNWILSDGDQVTTF